MYSTSTSPLIYSKKGNSDKIKLTDIVSPKFADFMQDYLKDSIRKSLPKEAFSISAMYF